jgi:hypothetical protein
MRTLAKIVLSLLFLGRSMALIAEGPEVATASTHEISNGDSYDLSAKGFSITPPKGWEILKDITNVTLFMRAPHEDGVYQRNIQILLFKDPIYIDEATGADFEEKILTKYSNISPTIKNFSIRSHSLLKLLNGQDAILFYTTFDISDQQLMQAHILTSSGTHHYLLSYTDLRSHFEGADTGPFLKEAWASMTSIEVDSPPPKRKDFSLLLFLLAAGVIIGTVVFFILRKKQTNRLLQDNIEMDGIDPVEAIEEEEEPPIDEFIDDVQSGWNLKTPEDDK